MKRIFSLFILIMMFSVGSVFAHDFTLYDFEDSLSSYGISLLDVQTILGSDYQAFINYYFNSKRFYVFKINNNEYIFSFDSSGSHINRFVNGSSSSRPNDILFQISSNTYHINFSESTYKFVAYGTTQQIKWFSATDYEDVYLLDKEVMTELANEMIVIGYNMNFIYYFYPNGDTILLTGDKNFGSAYVPPADSGGEDEDVESDSNVGYIPPKDEWIGHFIDTPNGFLTSPGFANVKIFLPNDWPFDEVFLLLGKYNVDGTLIDKQIIQCYDNSTHDNIIWDKVSTGIYSCSLSDWYDFDTTSDCYYAVNLYHFEVGYLDSSKAFYFNYNLIPDNSGFVDSNLGFDTNSIDGLINSTSSWVTSIFGFLNIFPPWFISCIVGSIAVVVVCRILGR